MQLDKLITSRAVTETMEPVMYTELLNACFLIAILFLLLVLYASVSLEISNPRGMVPKLLNMHGILGFLWVINATLMAVVTPDFRAWVTGGEYESSVHAYFYIAIGALTLLLVWSAPRGVKLKLSKEFDWYSDGRYLSIHLNSDELYKVNKQSVKECAEHIYKTMREADMPLYISTPLNIEVVIRELENKHGVTVNRKVPLLLSFAYVPFVIYKKMKRSGLSFWHAFTQSWVNRRVILELQPQ